MEKEIEGFSLYTVNEKGEIFRKEHTYLNNGTECVRKRKKISSFKNPIGYCQATMKNDNGEWKKPYVHVLVAEAFIPKPKDKVQVEVNHIDGNKSNNTIENLEWLTHSENLKHAVKTGLLKVPESEIKNEIPPKEQLNDMIKFFNNYTKVSKYYKVSESSIRRWCKFYNIEIIKGSFIPSKEELTDMMIYFKSFFAVAPYYSVNEATVRKWCRKYNLPDTVKGWK